MYIIPVVVVVDHIPTGLVLSQSYSVTFFSAKCPQTADIRHWSYKPLAIACDRKQPNHIYDISWWHIARHQFHDLKISQICRICSLLVPPWEDVQEAQQRFFGAASQWVLGARIWEGMLWSYNQLIIIRIITHRIHGAGIFANIKGVYWWYIDGILMGSMLPYIAYIVY